MTLSARRRISPSEDHRAGLLTPFLRPHFVDAGHFVYRFEDMLLLAEVVGGTPMTLHRAPPGQLLSHPAPSRDGRWLTWIDRSDESDIWLMTLEEEPAP